MKSKKLSVVFITLLLVGCSTQVEPVLMVDIEPENTSAILNAVQEDAVEESTEEEMTEEMEEAKEETSNSFSSESNLTVPTSITQPEQREPEVKKEEEKKPDPKPNPEPVIEVPVPQPDPPKPEPTPAPAPEKPKEEPKKTFVLPANWSNSDEHHEYYLTTAEAAARVRELWDQRKDAGYSELFDAETNTTYAWVTWWE